MNTHPIPPITDPLGKHWKQPDREGILIDETHALMTQADFDKLANYQHTNPTGIYDGKMWRRGNWLLWVQPCNPPEPGYSDIVSRKILTV